jgi:uncharacterized SAM-binding protein YcdF (DUF218 family)
MHSYDTIVILGSRPKDPVTWQLPSHIYTSLDTAILLFNQQAAKTITVSGKWTINFDVLNIQQPFRECEAMADYLIEHGVPDTAILRETESQDTISNLYYLKQLVFEPNDIHRLLFIAAEARLERIMFLAQRILGPDYEIATKGVAYDPADVSPHEKRTLAKQAAFLAPMQDGDDHWLDGKFYTDPFYDTVRARVIERAAQEPFLHLSHPPYSA